jgi:hypothetical protein
MDHMSVLCIVTESDYILQSMRKVVTEVQLHLLSSCSRRLIHSAIVIASTNETSLFNRWGSVSSRCFYWQEIKFRNAKEWAFETDLVKCQPQND